MLSYQHIYHAGNLADVQKHALLAWMLDYLTQKDKPLSYIETHAGRGLYDLGSDEAVKTGEADAGVAIAESRFAPNHPYRQRLAEVRARYGDAAYPGSPLIAALTLRDADTIHLAELHPQEFRALTEHLSPWNAHCQQRDGFDMALALCPPTPRRGLMLIDPSYEVKADYDRVPKIVGQIARKWNVGIIALWYPILTANTHAPMLADLTEAFPDALRTELRFPPARDGHRMTGSGMFVINPPFGLAEEAARINTLFPPN
ncbi:MAG: 23S rRNA (adenine(2030)-N(6))-methyltransferase RlmJ [Paracoccaceae bacterium]